MPHYTGGLSSGLPATTLTDGLDPIGPVREIPGGFVPEESVRVQYSAEAEHEQLAVTLEELADWLRVESDGYGVMRLALAIQAHVEAHYGLALTEQTVTCLASGPCQEVRLPRVPAKSLTSVTEVANGSEGSDESSNYYLQSGRLHRKGPGRAVGARYPVRIVYEAGYGEGDFPPDLRLALERAVRTHYDERSDINVGNIVNEMPHASDVIFRKYGRP